MCMTREFKVGDRVVANYGGLANGRTGTVVDIYGSDIGVEFDGDFDGHDLNGKIKSKHGWWVNKANLKFIPKFKVGDRVKVLDGKNIPRYTGGWVMSKHIGNVYTISKVDTTYSDNRFAYRMKEVCCDWDERGLELVTEKVEKKETKPTTKYKAGDKVKVREDLKRFGVYKMDDSETKNSVVDEMYKFRGRTVTIKRVTDGGQYQIKEDTDWYWTDEMFEGLTSECEKANKDKILIYCEGRHVIAKNTETGETAKATCHPDDKFDFNIGAKLAFERLMNPTKIVKQSKYEIGDKVKIINKWVEGCYQNREGKMDKYLGKVMTIRDIRPNGDYKMVEDELEHCKGWYWNDKCIEGKVVTVEKAEIKEVTEEKRYAEVGEYIKIVDDTTSFGYYKNGDILKVTSSCKGVVYGLNLRTNDTSIHINPYEYVVLNGYEQKEEEPKKEEPKLYNGKVVCVDLCGYNRGNYTVGKIYEIKDGKLTTDCGDKLPIIRSVHSFKEWEEFTSSKFIEVVE